MTNKILKTEPPKAYKDYINRQKAKLMDFDFADCPPAEQFADALVEQWLATDWCELSTAVDDAIALLQQWKQHACQVIEAEENS